ncbi:trypsin-like peptidase domain-containing protein [Planctomycetota bacterium]
MKKGISFIAVIILICACSLSASERGFPDTETEKEIQELFKKVRPAYVFVAGGSGAVISPDGLVITNSHVVRRQKKFNIRLGDGRSFKADLLGNDPRGDLALLQIKGGADLPYLPLANSDAVRLGQFCIAIGNPFGMGFVDQEPTLSFGVVSGNHVFQQNYTDAIVTDAPINPGNSGGPLINWKGELIGVNGMMQPRWGLRSNTGLGYAIPANQVKRWIPVLQKAGGKVVLHGRLLGLVFERADESETDKVLVKEVKDGSDASEAGFKPGDEIVSFDNKPVWSAVRFSSILGTYPKGAEVTVKLKRGGKTKTLKFVLKELRPGKFGFALKTRGINRNDTHMTIKSVTKGSNAEKAGLKKGDKIVSVQDQPMTGSIVVQLLNMARWMPRVFPQTEIKLRIKRKAGNEETEMKIVFETE